MKRALSLIMIGLLCIPLFSVFIPYVKGQETVIFQDDFESYAVGSFPSSGGWKLVYNGAGDPYQVITSDYAVSGTKSLQMKGQYGWSAVVAKDFSSSSNLIGFEAYLMGTPGSWLSVGFGNETIQPWGRLYGVVGVDTIDGYIVAGGQNLQPCTANTWYKIRVVMDRNARTYDVWIDDQLKGTNIPEPNDPWEIQSLRFDVGWHNVMNYYDNVKVFEVSEALPLSVSINPLVYSLTPDNALTFTSTVSGGISPYSYQWYLNGNPVSEATSASWTFTPTSSGIYYVYLKVTDAIGNTAQSETARITVATVPVGGYSIPINKNMKTDSTTLYITLIAALTIAFTAIKRKTTKKNKKCNQK